MADQDDLAIFTLKTGEKQKHIEKSGQDDMARYFNDSLSSIDGRHTLHNIYKSMIITVPINESANEITTPKKHGPTRIGTLFLQALR